jgi:hypothetical protein
MRLGNGGDELRNDDDRGMGAVDKPKAVKLEAQHNAPAEPPRNHDEQ